MQTQRRYLRVVVPVALVAAAVGLLAGGANAADGYISVVAGHYRGASCSLSPPNPDPGLSPVNFVGDDALSIDLSYNLVGVARGPGAGPLFVADRGRGRIQQISGSLIQTVAGGGTSDVDGGALQAALALRSIATDPSGHLYLVDIITGAPRIRTIQGSIITTVQAPTRFVGTGDFGLAADGSGNLYLAGQDQGGGTSVGRIDSTGAVTVFPGASGNSVTVDATGTTLYATDRGNYGKADGKLYRVDLAGGGTVTMLRSDLQAPSAVAVDPAGDRLFVAEGDRGTVSELDPTNGHEIQRVAGTGTPVTDGQGTGDGGKGDKAGLAATLWLAVDANVNVYILDSDNCVLRMVEKMPVAGATAPTTAPPVTPSSVVFTQNTTPPGGLVVPPPGNVATAPAPVAAGGQNLGIPPVSAGGSFTPGVASNPVGVSAGLPGGVGLGGGQSAPALGPLGAPTPVIPGPAPVAAAPFPPGIPPAPALVLGTDALAAANAANAAAGRAALQPEAEPAKGAPRYTMVANHPDHGLPPFLFLAAFGVVGLFGCVVAAAARAEDNAVAARAGYETGTEQFRTRRPGGGPWEEPRPEAKRRGWGGTARGDRTRSPDTINPAADRAARRTTPASPCRPRW